MVSLPVDPVVFAAVVVITFVFDLVDLNPQVGSFSFLRTIDYVAYFSIRVIFGTLAAILLQATGLIENSLLLAFASVVAAVSTLQNFGMKIGGQDIADLPSLFDNYRKKMIDKEQERRAHRQMSDLMKLANDLAGRMSKELLQKHALMCLHELHKDSDKPAQEAQKRIGEIEEIAGKDETLLKMFLAREIVTINDTYARELLATGARP